MAYTDQSFVYTQDITADNQKQLVDILTVIYDGEAPHRRKDSATLKLKILTGGDLVDVFVITDNVDLAGQLTPIYVGSVQTDIVQEAYFDLSDIIGVCKSFQIRLVGIVADFNLASIIIDYTLRPEQTDYLKITLADLGIISPNKKRMRVWPVTVDVLDAELASIVPYIDGVAQPELVIQNDVDDVPKTHLYQFVTDVIGIDFALVIHSCCAMEIYKIHPPIGVQILPIAKRFDQVGPEEFFKYGKLRSILVRLYVSGGTSIPYTIYFQDAVEYSGTLTVVDAVEDTYQIDIPRTVAGQITRIEFGPTSFDFHRYYIRAQVAKSGRDTENEWVPMTDNYAGEQSQ